MLFGVPTDFPMPRAYGRRARIVKKIFLACLWTQPRCSAPMPVGNGKGQQMQILSVFSHKGGKQVFEERRSAEWQDVNPPPPAR